jgi:hypothetical protein
VVVLRTVRRHIWYMEDVRTQRKAISPTLDGYILLCTPMTTMPIVAAASLSILTHILTDMQIWLITGDKSSILYGLFEGFAK